MKHRRTILTLCTFLLCLLGTQASADDPLPLAPLPSVPDFTRGSGWGLALGVGVEYESAYDGSDEYEFEVQPAGAVQWRTNNHLFFWEGIELGWRSRMADIWLVQLAARYEAGRESDDSDDGRLDGLDDRDDEMVGVFEIRRSFGQDWRNWVGARVMAGDGDFGLLGVLAAGHRFGSKLDGTGAEIWVFTTFGSSDFIDRDFGVSASESAESGLEETDLSGGYRSAGISIIDRRYVIGNFQLVSQAGFELYSGDIQDSPIAREDYEMEVGFSLVYHF